MTRWRLVTLGALCLFIFGVGAAGALGPAPSGPIPVGTSPYAIVSADFNRDGHLDLAVTNTVPDNSVSILLGNGTGGFTAASGSPVQVGSNPVGIGVGEFSGDGHPDLAVANAADGTVSILLGNGSGGFAAAAVSPVSVAGARALAVADFNGDGRADIVVTSTTGSLTLLLGDGHGGFGNSGSWGVGIRAAEIVAADFNGDGYADLAVCSRGAQVGGSSSTVTVLLGDGQGGFSGAPGSPIAVTGSSFNIVTADFNGDGHPDLAFATFSQAQQGFPVDVLLGDGSGGFSAAPGSPISAGPFQQLTLSAADFNGDGYGDLAMGGDVDGTGTHAGSVTLARGGVAGNLSTSQYVTSLIPPGTQGRMTAADFDGDGRPDIGVTNRDANNVSVLLSSVPGIPQGPVGISVNDGDFATSSANVMLFVVPPTGEWQVLVSNDGGFKNAQTLPITGAIPWTLVLSGLSERLPRIVYLRFPDSSNPTQTFFDDIVLDTTTPQITAASSAGGGAARAAARATNTKKYKVRLTASEKRSGISQAQFSTTTSGGTTVVFKPNTKRGILKLTGKVVAVATSAKPKWVRVRSAAGRWSKWHKIK